MTDRLVAIVVTLLILPVLFVISVLLLITGEGEIFYFQERIGLNNRPFRIWKFATMLKNSPNMAGGIITIANDPRVTPIGRILRKTKLNELPQLVNIIRGEMSFVGPRPVMKESFDQYPALVQTIIYQVKPGLTGIGSIVFRDEEDIITKTTQNGESSWDFYRQKIYPHKGKLEKWYQNNQSLILDLLIIFLTAWVVLFPQSQVYYRWFPDLPKRDF